MFGLLRGRSVERVARRGPAAKRDYPDASSHQSQVEGWAQAAPGGGASEVLAVERSPPRQSDSDLTRRAILSTEQGGDP